jgi:hypothetical protein
MRLIFWGVFWGVLVVCANPASLAAQPSAKGEARRHHEAGLALVKNKSFGEAIAEFNQAYDLGHDATVLHEIGRAYIAIDQPVFAVDSLKKYLRVAGKQLSPAKRRAVEAEIAKQENRIATLQIQSSVAGAVLRIDGMDMGKTPLAEAVRVTSGAHLLTLVADGHRPHEQRLELAGGDRRTIDIHLEPDAAVAPAATAEMPTPPAPSAVPPVLTVTEPVAPEPQASLVQTPAPAPRPVQLRRPIAYALGGLALAGLAVGAVYGVRAISKRHDSDAECPGDVCSQRGVDLNNDAKTAAHIADVGVAVGIVSAAIAAYLLVRSPAETAVSTASTTRPRLSAQAGPGMGKLVLGGSW